VAYPPWMPQPPPPVDPALAGGPTPPWLAQALSGQADESPLRPDTVPPPWVNLNAGAPPPSFAPELAGAPGAPPPAPEPPPGREPPFWANATGTPPGSVQGKDVPVIEDGQGLQLQAKPTAPPPPARPAAAPGKNAPGPAARAMSYADVVRQQAEQEQASIGRQGDLDAQAAQARAEGLAKQAEYEQASIKDRQLAEMKRREDLARREAALEAERQAIANTKIDNNQWYSNLSDGKKAAAMVGAFLGGMLAVSTGKGKNDFTDWMDAQAAQNIESQKAMLANRQEALGHGESMYSKLLQRYGDERVADEMFASAYYTAIGHEAAAQAAQFDAPKAKENATMMAIQAGQRANEALQKAAMAQQEMALKKQQVGIQGYEARTGRMNAETSRQNADWSKNKDVADLALEYEKLGYTKDAAAAKARADAAKQQKDEEDLVIYGPNGRPIVDPKSGKPLRAEKPEIAAEERNQMASGWAYYEGLQKYHDFVKAHGREFGGALGMAAKNDALAKAESMWTSLMYATKNAEKTGALDKGMVDTFETLVPRPSTWTNATNPAAGSEQAIESYRDKTNTKMRVRYGYGGGNWLDNYEAEVPNDQSPMQGEWAKNYARRREEMRQKQEAQQEELRAQGREVPGYRTGPPLPIGTPGSMGMRDESRARPEELTRARKPPSDQQGEAELAEMEEIDKQVDAQPVLLRTSRGSVQVPRGSVNIDNAYPLDDGSFASSSDPPPEMRGVMPVDWAQVYERDAKKAGELRQKQGSTVGQR